MSESASKLIEVRDDPVTLRDRADAASWQAPLLDLLCSLARHRIILLLVPLIGLAAGITKHARTADFYRASSVVALLPREQPTVDVSVLSGSVKTTDDGAQRADTGLLMLPPQTDLYVALIYSRSVLEALAGRLGSRLITHGSVKSRDRSDEVVLRLRDMIKVEASDDGLLTITVTADEPVLAAELTNALVDEMRSASEAIERQLLVQQVGYLEDAALTTEAKLDGDELVLKEFCRKHKIIDPGMQSADRLRHIRELTTSRDEAVSQRVQRLVHFTEADPVVRQLDAEIDTKNKRIEQLRSSFAGDIDEAEYGRLLIELEGLRQRVRYRRDLLSTLSTQAEVFRIRADQPAGNLAVIRPAVAILRPAGPSRKKAYGLALGGSIVLAVCLALLLDQVVLIRREPLLSAKLGELRVTALRRPRFSLPFRRSAFELP